MAHSHSPGHHSHGHAHFCGIDHHSGEYTAEQRADLDLVLAFNRRLAAAIEACRDVSGVEKVLDPDPLRYMWVDEGVGRLGEFLRRADEALAAATTLPGQRRVPGQNVSSGAAAARPAVAASPTGDLVWTWVQWRKDVGETVLASLAGPDGQPGPPAVLSGTPTDCFRPTAAFDRAGRAWVCFGRAEPDGVRVWACRHEGGRWSAPEVVSTTGHPSFNQEVLAHADGSVEVCWQGHLGGRFGIYSRRWADGRWQPEVLVSDESSANVWDPALAATPTGGTVYGWSEYHQGTYRVVVRHRDPDGVLAEPRPVSSGTDYALHPSVAVTSDGGVWCAFDVITVHGHGGSGPTRLRAAETLSGTPEPTGMRAPGEFIPPELLPDIEASMRVVRVDTDSVREPLGELAPRLDTTPCGLPKLVATGSGLVLAYRYHRRLPLMTYYWEVASQTLGPDGWSPPTTYAGSDSTLEEPGLAALGDRAVLTWQVDGRLQRGLEWTEGFGGRECPFLLEHQGEVIWHSVHGTGAIRHAEVPAEPGPPQAPRRLSVVSSDRRREARTWLSAERDRYRTRCGDREYQLYWGDLHRHSLVSRCTSGDEPSLEDFYRYSWDVCEYDFWAVTDHAENSSDYQWWSIQKMADLFRIDGRFIPLYGFEWTGMSGHQNVIFGDVARGAPIYSSYAQPSSTPARLWELLDRHPDYPAITIPHHPGSAMVPFDWDYYDPRYLRLAEVFQACRGNYEDDNCYRQYSDGTLPGTFVADGLRRGYRYGLIASSDHGHGASYVGAYAESLDRAAVFDALQQRRVFGASTRGIVLDFRVQTADGTAFMGAEITTAAGPVEVAGYVRGYTDLARVDVIRNGETVHSVLPVPDLPGGWLSVPLRLEWGRGHATVAWDGTLRIDGGRVLATPFWSPEVTAASAHELSWAATTQTFGVPYGAQRGGIELTLVGPPDAAVTVRTAHGRLTAALGTLGQGVTPVPVSCPGQFQLQPGIGGLASLGTTEHRLRWADTVSAPAWYYLRVIQVDGEMAWSSPIWIDPR
ncbi:MAG TPA: DUF3604 domain-containing protein [Pseudonocardia sp.]|uniref:DUF3604 domain-containing protein n=1 Tax=Pseudonocardia sp. TaxID=60912 RepID=UPI002C6CF662|nr:DUF3604 domain-containing protein [Pseudonocardia sp.]HTF54865.1 DUF3604 domain-containing protein [Pseudonocardia sp.]